MNDLPRIPESRAVHQHNGLPGPVPLLPSPLIWGDRYLTYLSPHREASYYRLQTESLQNAYHHMYSQMSEVIYTLQRQIQSIDARMNAMEKSHSVCAYPYMFWLD